MAQALGEEEAEAALLFHERLRAEQ